MIIVDASAMIELLLQRDGAPAIESRVFRAGETLHVPHLLDLEVAQVLRRFAQREAVSPARCQEALDDLADLSLARYAHDFLLPRIWALRPNLSAYDAAYVALAEALDAPVLTLDRRLAAAPGHTARVEVI